MTKQGLIQALEAKYFFVLEPVKKMEAPTSDARTFCRYFVTVGLRDGDSILDNEICFFVINEGDVSETAFWAGREPLTGPPVDFEDELHDYIESKILDGVIEGAFVRHIDLGKTIARVEAIIESGGTLEIRNLLVDKDSNGVMRHRMITG